VATGLFVLWTCLAQAQISIQFDYTYDTNGFFSNPNQTRKRGTLDAAAAVFTSRINDHLSAIVTNAANQWALTIKNPANGLTVTNFGYTIPTNTVVIFVGARNLGSIVEQGTIGSYSINDLQGDDAWLDTILYRGQSGASNTPPSDFGPWGGAISFNSTNSWFFSGSTPSPSDSFPGQIDLYSEALNGLGQIFGIGVADSWKRYATNGAHQFLGANAIAANGGTPPSVEVGGGHWAPATTSTLPGTTNRQEASMTSLLLPGARKYFTDLDFAGLKDIGWQVSTLPPSILTQPTNQTTSVGSNVTFTVVATGTLPLYYQWRSNNVNIALATNASLTLNNVQTNFGTNYLVVITNSAGSVTSSVATLTVLVPPSISAQPTNQSIVLGSNVTFTVVASGTPPLSYQWLSNGLAISSATGSTLTLNNVQTNFAADYSVLVLNSAGSVLSSVATLTVLVPPTISTQPTNQTVIAGSSATFTVVAAGTTPFSYQWRSNGVPIAAATSSSLVLNNVQTNIATNYSVIVTNVAGSVTSVVATLTVLVPPSISSQPSSQSVVLSSNVTFSVVASGTSPLSYQWLSNGLALPSAIGSSLVLNNVQTNFAADYSVIVTNVAGSITSLVATLTVLVPPTISAQPTNQTVIVGSTATFAVVAAGTTPFSYQWRSNGVVIASATGSSLVLNNVQTNFGPNYSVIVTNVAGSVTSVVATLTVLVPPTISSQPTNQTAIVGSNVTFNVLASGTAPLSYQWLSNGFTIPSATGASLPLNNVQTNFAANYSVIITNVAGSATSAVATLTILAPPSISTQPLSTNVPIGSNVTFSVVAGGTGPLSYQWRSNGVNLVSATSSSLTLSNVQTNFNAGYSVVITNVVGSVTSLVATLTVNFAPIISVQPLTHTVPLNGLATLTVVASGSPAPTYQWQFNGTNLSAATAATLSIASFQATNQGTYHVVVTNLFGSVTSSNAIMLVNSPTRIVSFLIGDNGPQFQLIGIVGSDYTIAASTNLHDWVPLTTNNAVNGFLNFTDPAATNFFKRFYRANTAF
jgi:hypothetical protein